MRLFTLLARVGKNDQESHCSYEVFALTPEDAARLALADIRARGEEPLDFEHAEIHGVAAPGAQAGVRIRVTGGYHR